jgi:hypothetical protein
LLFIFLILLQANPSKSQALFRVMFPKIFFLRFSFFSLSSSKKTSRGSLTS